MEFGSVGAIEVGRRFHNDDSAAEVSHLGFITSRKRNFITSLE